MLEGSTTEDLESRWSILFGEYKIDLQDLKEILRKVNIKYKELELIESELGSRGVEIEKNEQA